MPSTLVPLVSWLKYGHQVSSPVYQHRRRTDRSLLRHSHTLVNLPPEKITWCYGEWQPLYSTLSTIHPNLECVEGLPDLSSFDPNNRNLVVIDDLMSETDERVTKLFTKNSHHCNNLLTYAFSLARSIGHRLRNATVFCLWPSSPFLSRCTPSLLYLFLCLSARCFVAYLFFSSLGGSM